jgi:hypothetical protein
MTYPLVYIIILNWNGKKFLPDCLNSLLQLTYPNYQILLVDNASTDGSREFVKENYPSVKIIANRKNYGFAKGNNIGIRYAIEQKAKYIVLLNNDTEVDKDWLSVLVEEAERNPSVAVLGSKILIAHRPQLINSTGHLMNLLGQVWDRGFGYFDGEEWDKKEEVLGVCGAAFFVRTEVCQKVGLLDPLYYAYFEDVDWSVRIRKAGYKILYVPPALLYHKFSGSSGGENWRKIFWCERNKYYFILKFFPFRMLKEAVRRNIKNDWQKISIELSQKRRKNAMARILVFPSVFFNLFRVLMRRFCLPREKKEDFLSFAVHNFQQPVFENMHLIQSQGGS